LAGRMRRRGEWEKEGCVDVAAVRETSCTIKGLYF
jgi:hypothetical protein